VISISKSSFDMNLAFHICLQALLLVLVSAFGRAAESPVGDQHAERMKKGLTLFSDTIRPALVEHCLDCHGGEKTRGGLNLASRDNLLAGGDSGAAIDLAHPAESFLLVLMRHEEEPFMPAKKPQLDPALQAEFEQWIELGAPYDSPLVESGGGSQEMKVTDRDREFWSFPPLAVSPPPGIDDPWIRSDIDRFVLARLQQEGLAPNPSAEKRQLARRAFLDLTGLPPTPEQMEVFLSDKSSQAWPKLIDRLLASEDYGPRAARFWMDVARFAESSGFEHDSDRKTAYHYRDFLIRAFNDDLGWDEMVSWQLAGDELAPENPLAIMATGFLSAGVFPTQLTEAEFESARYDEIDDMVGTTGMAFLGLSVGCARCHDHKYDPFPVKDYYEMAATFATAIRSEQEIAIPFGKQDKARVLVCSEGVPPVKHHADKRGYPHFYPDVHYLSRGDASQKGDVAKQSFLEVLMPHADAADQWVVKPEPGSKSSFRRASLANWMTDTEAGAGHLLARVIVNRVWQQHFGRGIVATANDFGFQGERPTHPELLDWLANDLIENGWRLKRLHRMIMTSAAYRQSSSSNAERIQLDPDNRFLWRFAPRRLEAEAIRDSVLAVSGQLDRTPYGAGSLSPDMKRRSIYFTIKRSRPPNAMIAFDWPEHLVSIGQRSTTTIAPQALHFMNSDEVRSSAAGLARRAADVNDVYELALNRPASDDEIAMATSFIESQAACYQGQADAHQRALVDFCQAILGSNEFLYLQ